MLETIGMQESMSVLPLASVTRSLTPADFQDVSYSPRFLLPVQFDASMTTDSEYQEGCESGFYCYFEDMFQQNEAGRETVFLDRFYSRADVMSLVVEGLSSSFSPSRWDAAPLSYSVGFVLGWLSALALTDRPLALGGLELLTVLVAHMI
jgi:hypothetical protein